MGNGEMGNADQKLFSGKRKREEGGQVRQNSNRDGAGRGLEEHTLRLKPVESIPANNIGRGRHDAIRLRGFNGKVTCTTCRPQTPLSFSRITHDSERRHDTGRIRRW
jgi:hypothetical protein